MGGGPRAVDFTNLTIEWQGNEAIMFECSRMRYHMLERCAFRFLMLCDGTRSPRDLAIEGLGIDTPEGVNAAELLIWRLYESELLEEDSWEID